MKETYVTFLIKNDLLYHVFQPIYHLESKQVIGYEALLRSKTMEKPALLFQRAEKENTRVMLDLFSFTKAIDLFSKNQRFKQRYLLFINIYPSTLLSSELQNILEQLIQKDNMKNVVLEINENKTVEDFQLLGKIINKLKENGFKFAIDDLGSNDTSLQNVAELDVDYYKVDQYFSKNLSLSFCKQKFISLLLLLIKNNDGFILEGIENEDDYHTAIKIGLQMGQGYFLGKPKRIEVED